MQSLSVRNYIMQKIASSPKKILGKGSALYSSSNSLNRPMSLSFNREYGQPYCLDESLGMICLDEDEVLSDLKKFCGCNVGLADLHSLLKNQGVHGYHDRYGKVVIMHPNRYLSGTKYCGCNEKYCGCEGKRSEEYYGSTI